MAEVDTGKLSKPGAVDPNASWKLTLHDWSCENEEALRTAMENQEDAEDRLETVAMDTFSTVLKDLQAPLEDDQLLNIILEHQKSGEEVMDLGKFFKGLRYLQKAFTLQSYVAKPKKEKKKKGEKGKGKFLLPAPICVMPRHLIRRRPDAGLPAYMIEKCLAALESGFFIPDHCPRNAIEDDRAWYTDPPDKVFIHINDCVKISDVESLRLAFSQGVPVDVQDCYYKTPLMTACSIINLEVVRFLISMGADVNARDQMGWTPLHHACHAGRLDTVKLLVAAGAKINTPALHEGMPLTRAMVSGALDCEEYLILAGANLAAISHVPYLAAAKAYTNDEEWWNKWNSDGTTEKTQRGPPKQDQKAKEKENEVLLIHTDLTSNFQQDISFVPRLTLPPQARGSQALIDSSLMDSDALGMAEASGLAQQPDAIG